MKTLSLSLIVFVLYFLINTNNAHSQHMPDSFYRLPIMILLEDGSEGSGFYFADSLYIYLVTARHCLIKEIITNREKSKDSLVVLASKYIRCILYPFDAMTSKAAIHIIDLEEAGRSEVLKYEKDFDIGVIRIGEVAHDKNKPVSVAYYSFVKTEKETFIQTVPLFLIQKYADVHIGDDVFIMGYPTSLGLKSTTQFDHKRPLLRKGIIAGKNIMKKTIILDCPAYYGNSGGPVFVRYMDTTDKLLHHKIIGVISEFIPYADSLFNKKDSIKNIGLQNSGYSVAVPFETIFDLFE